jgi:hypothetical protein
MRSSHSEVIADAVPVRWGLVTLEFGSGVDDELGGSAGFDGAGAFLRAGIVGDSETHFGGDDGFGGERVSDGVHDAFEGLGGVKKGCTAAVTVDRFCGTSEVDIDAEGAEFGEASGVAGHGSRIRPEDLSSDGGACGSACAVGEFGEQSMEGSVGKAGSRDPDEL